MTRFALIPLAILANACASSEDAQDGQTYTDEAVQRDIEELAGETARNTDAQRQATFDRIEDIFGNRIDSAGCEMVAAMTGEWFDDSVLLTTMIEPDGRVTAKMEGRFRYTDNQEGVFGAKGHDKVKGLTVVTEGDFYRDHVEADVIMTGENWNTQTFRMIGLKERRGQSGEIWAAVASCN